MSKQDRSLEERLSAYPELKEHVVGLLDVVESGIERADEVEERMIEDVQGLGRQAMEDWACRQEKAHSETACADAALQRHGKKNSTG